MLVLEPHRYIDRIVSLHLLGTLTEGLVAVVDSLVECTELPAGRGYGPSQDERTDAGSKEISYGIKKREQEESCAQYP